MPRPDVQVIIHGHPRLMSRHGAIEFMPPQHGPVVVRVKVLIAVHDDVLDAGKHALLRSVLVQHNLRATWLEAGVNPTRVHVVRTHAAETGKLNAVVRWGEPSAIAALSS